MEAHSANILRKSGRGASREGGGYVRAGAGQVEGWVPVRPARMASRWWGAASFPGTGCGGVSGAGRGSGCAASPGGAAVGWRTEGSGRCVVGAGRVLECRASGVVPRTGGAGSSGSRAGVGPVSGRCSVFGLFLSFSAASRRAGTDAVCKSAVSPLGKSEKVVFLFLLYN